VSQKRDLNMKGRLNTTYLKRMT